MSNDTPNKTADCNCPEGRCFADEMNDIGQNSLSRCPRAKADAPVSNAMSEQTALVEYRVFDRMIVPIVMGDRSRIEQLQEEGWKLVEEGLFTAEMIRLPGARL